MYEQMARTVFDTQGGAISAAWALESESETLERVFSDFSQIRNLAVEPPVGEMGSISPTYDAMETLRDSLKATGAFRAALADFPELTHGFATSPAMEAGLRMADVATGIPISGLTEATSLTPGLVRALEEAQRFESWGINPDLLSEPSTTTDYVDAETLLGGNTSTGISDDSLEGILKITRKLSGAGIAVLPGQNRRRIFVSFVTVVYFTQEVGRAPTLREFLSVATAVLFVCELAFEVYNSLTGDE